MRIYLYGLASDCYILVMWSLFQLFCPSRVYVNYLHLPLDLLRSNVLPGRVSSGHPFDSLAGTLLSSQFSLHRDHHRYNIIDLSRSQILFVEV